MIDVNLRLTYVIGGDSVEALGLLIKVGPDGKLFLSLSTGNPLKDINSSTTPQLIQRLSIEACTISARTKYYFLLDYEHNDDTFEETTSLYKQRRHPSSSSG